MCYRALSWENQVGPKVLGLKVRQSNPFIRFLPIKIMSDKLWSKLLQTIEKKWCPTIKWKLPNCSLEQAYKGAVEIIFAK